LAETTRQSEFLNTLAVRSREKANLLYVCRNFKFPEVHVEGARRIARISALSGVSRFVHVSHLNADHDSPSRVYRHKAEGEDAVNQAFPGATIVRPSWMYGHEDRLLNTIATSPSVFRINHGDTRIKPVHVRNRPTALCYAETS
jgi:NADH dehydrogenase (ubiquinone) 1 alpha subcomplex subunit 9